MSVGTLVIRADAGAKVGAGHLMRCLALAEAWIARRGRVIMAVPPDLPDGLVERIRTLGAAMHRLPSGAEEVGSLLRLVGAEDAAWIAVDGYRFGADWLQAISQAGRPVLSIDDDARHQAYPSTLILNQNLHARREDYSGKTRAELLLGPRFALIRPEFRSQPEWRRVIPARASKLLVTLGGADPGGHTARVIDALRGLEAAPAGRVVAGAANPRLEAVRMAAGSASGVEILCDVRDMGEQMRWCDLAVSASGSTVWELALFATPMLLGTASEVEEPVAQSLQSAGAALHLGRLAELRLDDLRAAVADTIADRAVRSRLSGAASGLVDGNGAARVVDRMLALSGGAA